MVRLHTSTSFSRPGCHASISTGQREFSSPEDKHRGSAGIPRLPLQARRRRARTLNRPQSILIRRNKSPPRPQHSLQPLLQNSSEPLAFSLLQWLGLLELHRQPRPSSQYCNKHECQLDHINHINHRHRCWCEAPHATPTSSVPCLHQKQSSLRQDNSVLEMSKAADPMRARGGRTLVQEAEDCPW